MPNTLDDPLVGGVLVVGGRPVPYRIRRSQRARHSSIQIHPRRGLEVVLPPAEPPAQAAHLLRTQARWLERHAGEVHRAARVPPPLQAGMRLPVRGDWLTLVLAAARAPRVERNGDALVLSSPDQHDTDALRSQLDRWYRRLAKRVLAARVAALHRSDDGAVTRITVRDQATLWASCTGEGALSFNWRLVMAPPPVLDAVVAHELVHLRLPDHSSRFWRALDTRFPRHRACRRWLHHNGPRLTL